MGTHDKHVGFKANRETLKQAKAKLDHGELSELLRQELDRIAHGADVAEENRLTDRLRHLRKSRRELRDERDSIESNLEEIERKIERIEKRLDELREQEGEYDGVLSMLEEDLHAGKRILGGSDKLHRAATIGDCKPEEVIADLKERNPDVPEKAYRPARGDEDPRWKSEPNGLRASFEDNE